MNRLLKTKKVALDDMKSNLQTGILRPLEERDIVGVDQSLRLHRRLISYAPPAHSICA
jgi:hypothetical protein